MDKLKMESLDITKCNIEKIGALFPNVLTESLDEHGKLVKAINFDKLRQELVDDVIDSDEESYDFTWVGKNQAIVDANAPIRKTLRPVVDDETIPTGSDSNGKPYCSTGSKNFDTTQNLYIEGDNLDVLKLLQESYLNSIKMIYIDPPYNTGKDSFVYPDDATMDKEDYEEQVEYRDEDGNIQFKPNNETNPRFHSDWCSMIYMRLKLAKNLLTDDGVIFISIDDNEVENLKKICNEVFGEIHALGNISWHRNYASANDAKTFSNVIDYILVYSKSLNYKRNLLPRTEKQNSLYRYDSNDGRGRWRSDNLSVRTYSANYDYPIVNPKTGETYYPPKGRSWITNSKVMEQWILETRVFFGQSGEGAPQLKRYLNEVQDGVVPTTYWSYEDVGHNDEARKEIKALFEHPPFDSPKPTRLLKQVLSIGSDKDSFVLDFFSGSATTAHAVMQLNAEDGGNRKFICVQLPEVTDAKSEASKAGFETICEIGKERIRLAGEKIKAEVEENNAQLKLGEEPKKAPDIGFRVLKVDDTNMKDVYYGADEIDQAMLFDLISNIKEDRTGLDLLYGVLLDWGIPLSAQCETLTIDGLTVYNYDDGSLITCLENQKVSETAIREIAKMQPLRVVFRDGSFENSPDKINVEEIFKLNAPNTSVRVI